MIDAADAAFDTAYNRFGHMPKIDLKKELKQFYTASASKAALVEVPKMNFLMIDGAGDPNANPLFQHAMEALFNVAYTLKFSLKRGPEKLDYPVMPPEGLWWGKDAGCPDMQDKASWNWTLMITQPASITAAMVRRAQKTVKEKKPLVRADEVRLEGFREGLAVQIMHLGPYSEEQPTIEKLHQYAAERGYVLAGKHHEIYLSDPRRAKPEKLRTIIRQPLRKAV
jgi:hypothetical protein